MMLQIGAGGPPPIEFIIVSILGAIPILGIMAWTAVKILGPIGQAFARRLSAGHDPGGGLLEQRVERLADELEQVRAQLAETHERLDFTERLLAQGKAPDSLSRG